MTIQYRFSLKGVCRRQQRKLEKAIRISQRLGETYKFLLSCLPLSIYEFECFDNLLENYC